MMIAAVLVALATMGLLTALVLGHTPAYPR